MRKSTLLLIFALMTIISHRICATPIDIDQARKIASVFLYSQSNSVDAKQKLAPKNEMQLELVYSDENCYVFNGNGGFVLISSLDTQEPILGYSKHGNFNAETMPDELKAWIKSSSMPSLAPSVHEAILPMTTTEWDQIRPYNAQIKSNYTTGCVATALAQMMAYHKWPNEVCKDVYDLPATSLNWSIMRDQYKIDDSDESAQEVAKLMNYCGAAVNTNYKYSGSTAYFYDMVDALKYYFDYAKTVRDIYRISYTTEEWDNIIYNELANGRPVLYSAQGSAGHALICDGYDGNGCYHINWGWSGDYNGYYRLPSLNGYTLDQAAIIGIEKTAEYYEYEKKLSYGFIEEWSYHSIRKRNSNGQLGVGFKTAWSGGWDADGWDTTYEPAGGLYKNNELIEVLPIVYKSRISDRPSFIYSVRIESNIPDGQYQLRMLYRRYGTEEWIEPLRSGGQFFELFIENDALTIKQRSEAYGFPSEDEIEITDMKIEGNQQAGAEQTLLISLMNKGTANAGKINVIIKSPQIYAFEGIVGYAINPGETGIVEVPFVPELAGEYEIVVRTNDWGYKEIATGKITISEQDSGITNINLDSQPIGIWSLGGQRGKWSGLNIIRYSDGIVRKVITK